MKQLLTFALLIFVSVGWSQADVSSKINQAFSEGKTANLKAYMMDQVDLSIEAKEGVYAAAEVSTKLDAFFAKHPATAFTVKHKGTSKLDDHYRIGDLTTKSGNYRVTYFMKSTPKGMKIKQIRIESLD
jgi:hypothetical protein